MSKLMQPTLFDFQDTSIFPRSEILDNEIDALASNSGILERGAIFTRVEVVDFILDLVDYNEDEPLHQRTILEPSFGEGDFLLPIIDRLLIAWKKFGGNSANACAELSRAICGVELHRKTFEKTKKIIIERLEMEGLSKTISSMIADQWLVQGDFLLEPQMSYFDFVVGNPPYVRQELIPTALLTEYRQRYKTMYDRADLYIPFIERSLSLLSEKGTFCFICADRWMKNRYGGPLREYVADKFDLKAYIDMVDTDAFLSEVSAYPAITVISKFKTGKTRIAYRPQVTKEVLKSIARDVKAVSLPVDSLVLEMEGVTQGAEPWLLESSDHLSVIRNIEKKFPTIEQAGCKVGIGVATGADKAFIGKFEHLDVEADRKLPMVATRDIKSGVVNWQGQGVINPFSEDGNLVNLRDYPQLANYLAAHEGTIKNRHCAKKSPKNWYRTIDRIWPELAQKPKLLIPDIKGEAHVVFEAGNLYPHHNLYYVVSEEWDLKALQAVLLSNISKLFVTTYSTKMRGGYLRFQAQYLRRICIPYWEDVPENSRKELILAANKHDIGACNRAVCKLYKLNKEEQSALGGTGD